MVVLSKSSCRQRCTWPKGSFTELYPWNNWLTCILSYLDGGPSAKSNAFSMVQRRMRKPGRTQLQGVLHIDITLVTHVLVDSTHGPIDAHQRRRCALLRWKFSWMNIRCAYLFLKGSHLWELRRHRHTAWKLLDGSMVVHVPQLKRNKVPSSGKA